jgi:hypothetical protein
MRERIKLVVLILFNATIIIIGELLDSFYGRSDGAGRIDLVLLCIVMFSFIVLGFITEDIKRLLIYSLISAFVHVIFIATGMYYEPARFYHIPFIPFISFALAAASIFVFICAGTGMILSDLFGKVLRR